MSLTSAELTAMRDAIEQLLPDTCNVCTITNTPDGEGGWTQTRGTSGTSIACRLDVVQGREQLAGGAIQPYISYVLSLPYDTTVNQTDIIEHNSISYAVKSVNLQQSWIAVRRLELEKM